VTDPVPEFKVTFTQRGDAASAVLVVAVAATTVDIDVSQVTR
jgi:hypothetical protein